MNKLKDKKNQLEENLGKINLEKKKKENSVEKKGKNLCHLLPQKVMRKVKIN